MELIPKLIQNISKRLTPQKIQIFQIFIKVINKNEAYIKIIHK